MVKFHLGYDTIMMVVLEVNPVLVMLYQVFLHTLLGCHKRLSKDQL